MAGILAKLRGGLILELGLDDARLDDHDVDAERRDLHAKRVGERFQRVFRGVVPGTERQGDLAADRGDVDDRAGALRPHGGQDELDEPGRREKVDFELVARGVQRHVLDGTVQDGAGVVDEDVDPLVCFENGVDRVAEIVLVPGVHLQRMAARLEQVGHLLDTPRGAVDDVPGAQQVQRGGVADPRRSAGDQAYLGRHSHALPIFRFP